jgi:hypothetical protein
VKVLVGRILKLFFEGNYNFHFNIVKLDSKCFMFSGHTMGLFKNCEILRKEICRGCAFVLRQGISARCFAREEEG